MKRNARIYVAGHNGVAGKALCSLLLKQEYTTILTRTRQEMDLLEESTVLDFFKCEKPEYVFICAGKSGGIAERIIRPVDFFEQNVKIQMNIMHAAQEMGTKKLLFMGSAAAYPENSENQIREEELLTGEIGNMADTSYALAKIAGVKMCEAYSRQYGCNFISVMPCAFFGEGSIFDTAYAPVVPSILYRMHQAKERRDPFFKIWGSGKPVREFLSSRDVADACLFLMNYENSEGCYNIGNGGQEISIEQVAYLIKKIIGYDGKILFDTSKPDGIMRKTLNSSRLFSLGWRPKDSFENSVKTLYQHYLNGLRSLST